VSEELRQLTDLIERACVLEVSARKSGNVHPEAEFEDLNHEDFIRSAAAAAPWLARAGHIGVGRAVRAAVEATRRAVGTNTNLGIALLVAPLASVPLEVPLVDGIGSVLDSLTIDDAIEVYQAIRMTQPGGLGEAGEADVADAPTGTLTQMMSLAADRDLIALQYANQFATVLQEGLPEYQQRLARHDEETAIIGLHLWLIAEHGDSLITRKCGSEVSDEARHRAAQVLKTGWPDTVASERAFLHYDHWLRGDGHRRNPGSTADLVAAILFCHLRDSSTV